MLIQAADCAYSQPTQRGRDAGRRRVQALEDKLRSMETLLQNVRRCNTNYDINKENPVSDMAERDWREPRRVQPMSVSRPAHARPGEVACDMLLETIFLTVGQNAPDDKGDLDYHGHSSGPAFLHGLWNHFEGLTGSENGSTFLTSQYPLDVSEIPVVPAKSSQAKCLPAKTLAQELVSAALDDACALIRFVHRPTFDRMFNRIYATCHLEYGHEDEKSLLLLYSVLALGSLFSTSFGSTMAISEG